MITVIIQDAFYREQPHKLGLPEVASAYEDEAVRSLREAHEYEETAARLITSANKLRRDAELLTAKSQGLRRKLAEERLRGRQ